MKSAVDVERHPLNKAFTWQAAGAPRFLSAAQVRAYDDDGFFVLDGALDGATVRRLAAEIDPFEERVEGFLRKQEGGRAFIARAGEITFSPHLVRSSAVLRGFCAGSPFPELVRDLIGPNVRLYWEQAVYKKPETDADFPWHQDNGYTFIEPQQYLTCWVALTDVDESNGCPWVVPGMHRLGTLRHWMTDLGWRCLEKVENAVPVPARAGSIIVFSSLTPHRTGPNRTSEVRKAYIVQFARDGARVVVGEGESRKCDDPVLQFPILVDGREPERIGA